MPSTTYVARRPGPFSALVQAPEIGGLRLEPHPPTRVLDRYYDTEDAALLRAGLALRVREQGGTRTAGLRALSGTPDGATEAGALPRDADLLGDADGRFDGRLVLPPGALDAAVREAVGEAVLRPLLSLRQYRTPRVAYDLGIPLGVVSFDVVVVEVPGSRVVSNEVAVEPSPGAELPGPLDAAFRERGLEPAPLTAFERAVLRMPRTLSETALALPHEVRELEAAAASDDTRLARRARVVLLDVRGFRPDTIAAQTGLSMARVRHWRQRFREERLDMLALTPEAAPVRRAPAARPAALRPAEPSSFDGGPPPHTDAPRAAPSPEAEPMPYAPTVEGDGRGGLPPDDPTRAADMAELLDQFSPRAPDTPLFGEESSDDDLFGEDAEDLNVPTPLAEVVEASGPIAAPVFEPVVPPPGSAPMRARDPYPVVLGPVAWEPPRRSDAFAEVDPAALRHARHAPIADTATPPVSVARREAPATRAGVELTGDTPLVEAARLTLASEIEGFEQAARQFERGPVPSAARRLFVAAQRLRLAVETFGDALPDASGRLVTALRPLALDLTAALDDAVTAASSGDAALARRASRSLIEATSHLGRERRDWGARARRLLDALARQHAEGALRPDDAPLADDLVGRPGDAPAPTRLRHRFGSAVWSRVEAVRAFDGHLAHPTPDTAMHLAVALSALRYVLALAEDSPGADHVDADLGRAERAVTAARHRTLATGDPADLAPLSDVVESVTSPTFRARVASVVAAI